MYIFKDQILSDIFRKNWISYCFYTGFFILEFLITDNFVHRIFYTGKKKKSGGTVPARPSSKSCVNPPPKKKKNYTCLKQICTNICLKYFL